MRNPAGFQKGPKRSGQFITKLNAFTEPIPLAKSQPALVP
jgi:hypothetical protein